MDWARYKRVKKYIDAWNNWSRYICTQFLKSAITITIFQWNDAMKTFETERK